MIPSQRRLEYTEAGQRRLDQLKSELQQRVESALRDRKFVPGDEVIEVTASDLEELARLMSVTFDARASQNDLIRRSVLTTYSFLGAAMVGVGIFYEDFRVMTREPLRLSLLAMGLTLSFFGVWMRNLNRKPGPARGLTSNEHATQSLALQRDDARDQRDFLMLVNKALARVDRDSLDPTEPQLNRLVAMSWNLVFHLVSRSKPNSRLSVTFFKSAERRLEPAFSFDGSEFRDGAEEGAFPVEGAVETALKAASFTGRTVLLPIVIREEASSPDSRIHSILALPLNGSSAGSHSRDVLLFDSDVPGAFDPDDVDLEVRIEVLQENISLRIKLERALEKIKLGVTDSP
jgi:hypothetical protein